MTFTLPATVTIPTMADGDKIKITASYARTVAPTAGPAAGFMPYISFNGVGTMYMPEKTQAAGAETFNGDVPSVDKTAAYYTLELEVQRINATTAFYRYVGNRMDAYGMSTQQDHYFKKHNVTWSAASTLGMSTFINAGGSIQLVHLFVQHN